MRIFYAVVRSPNLLGLQQSNIWYNNLYTPLVELGHEVVEFEYDIAPLLVHADPAAAGNRAFVEEHQPKLVEALLRQTREVHNEAPIDLFFSYFYNSCATPDVIREIRSWGIVTVNFFCNNVHQFRLVSEIAPAYDYCMVPERVALSKYRSVGVDPIHIQMAANPSIYKPYPLPREFDVTFVGQRYANRPSIVDYLLRQGIEVRVWGPGWTPAPIGGDDGSSWKKTQNLWGKVRRSGLRLPLKIIRRLALSPMERRLRTIAGPPLSDEEMIKMYSRCKMSLGFSVVSEAVGEGEANAHLRLRDFEAPMSGALYATGYTEELADYFEPDKEVIVYRTKEELADKAQHYLAHPTEADRVREAGLRRARSEHTWTKRFEQLFREIGLS